jgi:formylglycine-generating enzyme required for sulfatase activity
MADIFISYKTERRNAAEHLAAVLELYGYSVWFDYQLIKGSDFGLQIGSRIREAKALVALWCSLSVDSRWVVEECDLAHRLGILVPAMIEPCELPIGFRRQDYVDLSAWDGSPRSHPLDPLIRELAKRIGRPPNADVEALWKYEDTWRRFGGPSLRAFALDDPVAAVEGDRQILQNGTAFNAAASQSVMLSVAPVPLQHSHDLTVLAGREWTAVRDSMDPQRLERFERHFAGTFYAEEARALREGITAKYKQQREVAERQQREREADEKRRRDAEEKRQQEQQKLRSQDRLPVLVGDRDNSQTRWLLPGAGEVFCDVEGGPEMVVVPAGMFVMGSPDGEPERPPSEGPRHAVMFAHPFAVGRHAVTRGQFAAFVNAADFKASGRWRDPGFRQDDSHPVVNISWDDARTYAAWLAEITGRPYRLLSEAEWEYVARAGIATPFWWGSSITTAQANYDGRYIYKGGGRKGEFHRGTVPVGSFDPNPWGLYNVHGNVWEWCEDTWHDIYYEDAPTDGSVWVSKGSQSGRVLRGGSWYYVPQFLRSASRKRDRPDFRDGDIGFRVARSLIA